MKLAEQDGLPELVIEDDGKGFERDGEAGEGIGLRIMHYRASIIGCNLTIKSAPNKGTCIRCRFGSSVLQNPNESV
jgi:signal transduction histidine kinase